MERETRSTHLDGAHEFVNGRVCHEHSDFFPFDLDPRAFLRSGEERGLRGRREMKAVSTQNQRDEEDLHIVHEMQYE